MTLRTRLAWAFGTAIVLALVIFALAWTAIIDRTLRTSLDAGLETTANAIATLVDVHGTRASLDGDDRTQFQALLGASMDAIIVLPNGRTLTTSSAHVPAAVTEAAAAARDETAGSSGSGERVARFVIVPIERSGTWYGNVAVWRGSDWIDEFDRTAFIAMSIAALLVGGVAIVISSLLARRALAPLDAMSVLAAEIEGHDLSMRIGTHGNDELGRLGAAFDRMLDRLEDAFSRQRRFTADASHELRAPLAVMRAEADLALRARRTGDEYRSALETIASEIDRLDELVSELLATARADADGLVLEPVDLGTLVRAVAGRFEARRASRGIAVGIDAREAWIEGDPQSIERAIAAVMHNAIEIAEARIEIVTEERGAEAIVRIRDDGPGFSSEALEHALERFWRGDSARRRGGSGLGLAIADAIARAHRGSLTIANLPDGGAEVVVRFHREFISPSS